jgi:protein-L-isoaspartate(D-aspartate) O-methyltransferase
VRHRFAPYGSLLLAYADKSLSIGYNQTVSQPYIFAFMTHALQLKAGDRVLEVGTGSGYQTAILAEIAAHVFTIEIVQPLAEKAAATLAELSYTNVRLRIEEMAGRSAIPSDHRHGRACRHPRALLEQLTIRGRLVLSVGVAEQRLLLYRHTVDSYTRINLWPVRFVSLVDRHGFTR